MLHDLGNWGKRREPRLGVMLHYDESVSDKGAVEWLQYDPRCKVSYNWIILRDGTIVDITPLDARAWHAGVCKPSRPELAYADANSAFWGVAIAASSKERATAAQTRAARKLVRALFGLEGWPAADTWRITSHRSEAWPRGRKIDVEGPRPSDPVMALAAVYPDAA